MQMRRRQVIASSVLLPLFPGCTHTLVTGERLSVGQVAANLGVCAGAYATLRAGSVDTEVVVSGCSSAVQPAANSVYQAASLTKPVVAYAAVKLALGRQLDLDAPVSRYLPTGYKHYASVLARGPDDLNERHSAAFLAEIPVATLLNHTSGLPNWTARSLSTSFQPASKWQYSGEGYMLLQSVIESVVGRDLSSFMKSKIFEPLGMSSSSMVWISDYEGKAQAGNSGILSPKPAKFLYPVAAASLYTTVTDYARFMGALFSNRAAIALTMQRSANVDDALRLRWGLGWGIEQTDVGPLLWQWGNNPGYRSFAMFSPSSGDGFVLLTSSEKGIALAVPLAHQLFPTEHGAFRFSMVG